MEKICRDCKKSKPEGNFPLCGSMSLKPMCKDCDNMRRNCSRKLPNEMPAKLTKLGDTKVADIEERLRMGYSMRQVSQIHGIYHGTLANWVKKGYISRA